MIMLRVASPTAPLIFATTHLDHRRVGSAVGIGRILVEDVDGVFGSDHLGLFEVIAP